METKGFKKTPMFMGEYEHAMDQKGRIALPVKFRQDLGGTAIVTRGFDSCLFVYPESEWRQLADRIASLPIAQANSRAFARLMLAGAMEVAVDKQGRIMVPDYLRSYASLSKKVVLAGLLTRMEIWDAAAWKEYRLDAERNSGAIAEALQNVGV